MMYDPQLIKEDESRANIEKNREKKKSQSHENDRGDSKWLENMS